jgi:RND family efflux transporter MFP subunit
MKRTPAINRPAADAPSPAPPRRAAPASALALLAAGLLLLPACNSGPDGDSGPQKLIPAVEAVQARYGSLPLIQRVSGVVKARGQVEIHPEIAAVVTEVLVADGDSVVRGQALVKLRATEFEKRLTQANANLRIAVAQLRRAEAQAREARAEYARLQSLAEESLASDAELEAGAARAETAEADVELAKARVDQNRALAEEEQANLDRTVVRSPIDGSVGSRDVEPGMLATPSTRLVTLGQLDRVRVQIILTDRMLAEIAAGQRTEILLPGAGPAGTVSAPLSRISPFLNPVSHTTEAEIDLPNPDRRLKPGMFVTVDVFYGESAEATLVPLSAVYEHPLLAQTGVYVARDEVPAEPGPETSGEGSDYLTPPVAFRFVPVELIAAGRMEAAVRPVEPGAWVVSLGQNLLAGKDAQARVRPVDWRRVERLQNLQREDLMRELNEARDRADEAGTSGRAAGKADGRDSAGAVSR